MAITGSDFTPGWAIGHPIHRSQMVGRLNWRGHYPKISDENILRTENKSCTVVFCCSLSLFFSNPGHKEWEQWLLLRYVSLKVPPWINRRPWMPRSPRSSAISARARSCGSARTTSRWMWTPCPPARSGSTSRSGSAACRAAAWSRSTVRNPPARPRWRCIAWRKRRRRAAFAPSSTPNTRSIRSMRASSASTSTTC